MRYTNLRFTYLLTYETGRAINASGSNYDNVSLAFARRHHWMITNIMICRTDPESSLTDSFLSDGTACACFPQVSVTIPSVLSNSTD